MNRSSLRCVILIFALPILLLASCASKMQNEAGKGDPRDNQLKNVAAKARSGQSAGLLRLTHRKLTLQEIADYLDSDTEAADKHLKDSNVHGYYSLEASQYPPKVEFDLYQINIDGEVHNAKTFFVNDSGDVVSPMDDFFIPISNNFLFFSNYLPGEPVDFVLASKDRRYFAHTRIVPNPVTAADGSKHTLSVEIDRPDKKHFVVVCSGLKPRQSYTLITRFESEQLLHTVNSNNLGEVRFTVGPTLPWLTGGIASVEVHGPDIEKPLQVEFSWGA